VGHRVPLPAAAPGVASVRGQSSTALAKGPLEKYLAMKAAGEIQADKRQEVAMGMLDDLAKRVMSYTPPAAPVGRAPKQQAAAPSGGGFFGGLFGGAAAAPKKATPSALVPKGPIGLYLWGGTGTGKTFLMDMFHETVPVDKKKRIHFHEWMIDVHNRLHTRQKGSSAAKDKSADDLIEQVAAEMMNEAWLLCFDEFQVTHISDAIIMRRIFSVLFERGAVVVATSNRPPDDLYQNGLNRPLFLPFIPMLKDFCEVHHIGADVDYRMMSTSAEEDRRVYIHPNGSEEARILDAKFNRLCRGEITTNAQVEIQGRKLKVPKVAANSNVAWFTFTHLCDRPLGAADYLAVAGAFHTIFMADIPRLTLQERDQVRRFITFVDAAYERHTKLICTAADDPIKLFHVTEEEKAVATFDEIFAWDRTVSRLIEMQSDKYLKGVARSFTADEFLGQYKIQSLTDEDLKEFWLRYDVDDNGTLDMKELEVLLTDLLEKQKGHRNLTTEVFETCVSMIDSNKDGVVSYEEFQAYLGDYTLVSSTVRL